ncbi:MAG: hypothetical protein FP811_01480 [Desulfobacteraceae bacterium]|nr:hypothetical protein [Desulfobacteraceae bacterium]MBU3980016.1 polysaccharide biosynthesis/export family protein [Pseudomonadota bacterium]
MMLLCNRGSGAIYFFSYITAKGTLGKQVIVRPDGKISFPLIGDVLVQGRTVEEVRRWP